MKLSDWFVALYCIWLAILLLAFVLGQNINPFPIRRWLFGKRVWYLSWRNYLLIVAALGIVCTSPVRLIYLLILITTVIITLAATLATIQKRIHVLASLTIWLGGLVVAAGCSYILTQA